ncbi:hypothetical protein CRE_10616 [Caenorhabditis remanei]|uniref:RING-type domain-containing protein n=1 Tax=Caenorhabditis remanei TaxID=31234 RepID=E3NBJ3_CAERE|nr:hypothetical protein CRE_10616 [Caenorhabditis remanei]
MKQYKRNVFTILIAYFLIMVITLVIIITLKQVDYVIAIFHSINGMVFPIAAYDYFLIINENVPSDPIECEICNLEYTETHYPLIFKECGHTFCESCVKNLQHCPTCRITVVPNILDMKINSPLLKLALGKENPEVSECARCHHPYNSEFRIPRILTGCGHTVCQECIQMEIGHRFLHFDMECPFCRNVTRVPDGSISKLPKNFAVCSVIEELRARNYNNYYSDFYTFLVKNE